jgi:hypothetical protein
LKKPAILSNFGTQKMPSQGKFHEIAKQFLGIFRLIPKHVNFQQFFTHKKKLKLKKTDNFKHF